MKKIVIIGAGYAGILSAKKLARRIKKKGLEQEVSLTLIDRNPFHTMLTELHEVAANRVAEENITVSLAKIFAKRKVDLVLDEISSVDSKNKLIQGRNASYSYDYLVIACGSIPTFFGVEGAKEHSFKLWSYEDAVTLKLQIEQMFRQAALENDPAQRRKLLHFCVVGAGFTGVEMAGELAEYLPILCERFLVKREDTAITVLDILERSVPNLSVKQSRKVERRLQKMQVNCLLQSRVCAISPEGITFVREGLEQCIASSTVIWAAGIESADLTKSLSASLSSPERSRGRLAVTPELHSVDDDSVYVVGDNMFYIAAGDDKPVAQMVENCEQCSSVLAHNLICELSASGTKKEYKPSFHGVMVSIGGRYAVAEVGTERFKISLASFFAMFVKHFINIIYYLQLCGWNKVYSYLKHEFFTIRHQRSFVGGHFANVTPSFLLVPLRIWLGLVWLFEGVKKVQEGWFEKAMLTKFFQGASSWFDGIINGVVGSAATADATSAASGVASSGEVLCNWNLLLARFQIVSAKALLDSGLSDFALRLQIPLMDLFLAKLVLPYPGVQIFMQATIVCLELVLGLCFILGAFNFLSSGISLVLQFMFVATTGLYFGTLWMIVAALAVLFGGGRTLGLDYYLMPALKRLAQKNGFLKKWYLYHD